MRSRCFSMPSEYIPKMTRRLVKARARGYCEYCFSPDDYGTAGFVVEHVCPRASGGLTILVNLAWSCIGCNGHKSAKTTAIDPVTHERVALFNPRSQEWCEHFRWDDEPTQVSGITACGRATVNSLFLNRAGVVNLRSLLVLAGKHPPDFG
jgi:HNH endonuclease